MQNALTTPLDASDLRTITGGGYYKLPIVGGPICELPGPIKPGYPTTDPVLDFPPYYTK